MNAIVSNVRPYTSCPGCLPNQKTIDFDRLVCIMENAACFSLNLGRE